MLRPSESFAAKILLALLGTVGLLLLVTFLVVRSEMQRQVEAATARAVESATEQFGSLQEIRRQQVARVARPLTEGRRTVAALDEAIEAGDVELLSGLARYELDLAGLEDVLVVFTDARARPVVTLHQDVRRDGDPVGAAALAQEALDRERTRTGPPEPVEAYRLVEGRLYSVRTRVLGLVGRPIGTLSFGLPLLHEDVARIGELVGAEVCYVLEGRCAAGSRGARGPLAETLAAAAAPDAEPVGRVRAAGSTWSVRIQRLDAAGGAVRALAVPLDPVLAPFQRINRSLVLGGAGALALVLLVGTLLSRGLTRPVRALARATEQVARGDYESEVRVESRDEVGRLGEAFNRMTRDLRLKEQYRSVLDKVVSPEVARRLMEGGVELGGEIRTVTVVFADIRGFTGLTEGLEPQAVIRLLNECMQRLSQAVEQEGGIVDKYVGDELMAVFGAPVRQGDDAARAVRAARRMQQAMAELNRERTARGEAVIHLGIGLNTGEVVAGNMGSVDRLNYTVLGSMVNLASRLCGAAGPGEILLSEATFEAVSGDCPDGTETIRREVSGLKGLQGAVSVRALVEVESAGGRGGSPAEGRASTGVPTVAWLAGLALGALLAGAPEARAQLGAPTADGWPTLEEAGVSYLSESGFLQVDVSGRAELESYLHAAADARPRDATALADGDGVWVAPRLRLLTDVFVGASWYGLVELRADRGHGPSEGEWAGRVEQAFLRWAHPSGGLALQAGRFATPFGAYTARHGSVADPFVRPPLPYDFRTMICPGILPPDAASFLTWKDDPDEFRPVGAPPVWAIPYQWGLMASGVLGRLDYRLAAMNSAPSSAPSAWGWDRERMEHPSWVAGVGLRLAPGLRVESSWSRGPYLLQEIKRGSFPVRPDGSSPGVFDYDQEIVSLAASWARGSWELRGELLRDRWEVPNMPDEDPVEWGWTVEARTDVAPGWWVAGRIGGLDFRPLSPGDPGVYGPDAAVDWDDDVLRGELAVGHRWARNAGVTASAGWTRQEGELDADDDLLSLRFWWAF